MTNKNIENIKNIEYINDDDFKAKFLAIIEALKHSKVLVAGDVMLDRYWSGHVNRISPEAPVPIVHVKKTENRLGGAANVALNIQNLGASAAILSIIGRDETAETLKKLCLESNIQTYFHHHEQTSILKLRVLGQNQQMMRIDFEEKYPVHFNQYLLEVFKQNVAAYDIIVLSDYLKGMLDDHETTQNYLQIAKTADKKVLIDPKGKSFERYKGAYLLTPNMREFEEVVGDCGNDEQIIHQEAQKLCQNLDLKALLITRSEKGMSLYLDGKLYNYAVKAREVYDVSGAGDTVLAVLAALLAADLDLIQAVYYANLAAGIVVGKLGTASVSVSEIQQALENL